MPNARQEGIRAGNAGSKACVRKLDAALRAWASWRPGDYDATNGQAGFHPPGCSAARHAPSGGSGRDRAYGMSRHSGASRAMRPTSIAMLH
jgi:hypothetical protein